MPASNGSSPQLPYRKQLTVEETEKYWLDRAAQCLGQLLEPKLAPESIIPIVVQYREIYRMLTQFEVAQVDMDAYNKAMQQRQREMEDEHAADYQRKADERGRRAARPIG